MTRKYRMILLLVTCILLIVIGVAIEETLNNLLESFWFSSGLLLLILLSLIDQPFFSKDSNIFVNAVTASISLLLVPENSRDRIFYMFVIYMIYLSLSSYTLMWIRKNPLKEEHKIVQFFSRLNRNIGQPNVIFSAFFLWGAIDQYTITSEEFSALLWFWVVFILLNIPELARIIDKLFEKKKEIKDENIGAIFGVQSQNTFLVKLNTECKNVELFEFVEFKYSVDNKIRRGLICDIVLLNQEQWIKVITNQQIDQIFFGQKKLENHIADHVYTIKETPCCDFLDRFIGIVTEESVINTVRFVYNSKVEISEGNLLEVMIRGNKVIYQIVEGKTRIEQLANKNQSGFIIGEAIQLGTWNEEKCQFDKFGWVPEINSPIYLVSNIEKPAINIDEVELGYLPRTNYPVVINKEVAITHHMAIIGVTGTGKSVFSRSIIREYLKDDNIKVICIDFTGEYAIKFKDLKPVPIIADTKANEHFQDIDFIETEIANNYNKDNKFSKERKIKVFKEVCDMVDAYIKNDDSKLSIFELPEVQNTSGVMKYTQTFFKALFRIAKEQKNHGKRICLVLEEAHTIIPEWNFAGISEKVSQPLINSIAQIALQGRKYNIGLLVIAQRTANVSKTILTQCNSIICFQEFDKTSTDFLANYFGSDIAATLSKLKFRQAVAAGKAFKSGIPMIFEIPEINEEQVDIREDSTSLVAVTVESKSLELSK